MTVEEIVSKQNTFFATGKTLEVEFRRDALLRLKEAIKENGHKIEEALNKDLRKSGFESYMTEIGMVLDDLGFAIKHVLSWSKPKRVKTPISQFKARSFVVPEPFGTTLIMSPWNYPFQLCMEPLIGAIAAGNTAVVKPSAYAPFTSQVISDILSGVFESGYVDVVQGGREQNTELLNQKWDYIFFTGSVNVGKLVMEKASANLTPISLELGGKSPVIIEKSADMKTAAKRLAFGKYVNAGQTCVAPDYLLIDKDLKEEFLPLFAEEVKAFFPNEDFSDMPVIINDKHFARVMALIKGEKVVIGGKGDPNTRFIEPTVLDDVSFEAPVMQEEIFGPVLPVITYDDLDKALAEIRKRPKPLALYLFTTDNSVKEKVLTTVSFGGGCINDTIIHLATPHMGFGGVGASGMGQYHGKLSFDTFTHFKSIVDKANWIDLPMRYHPYTEKKKKVIMKFMK